MLPFRRAILLLNIAAWGIVPLTAGEPVSSGRVKIECTAQGLNVSAGGELRLAGGRPCFQDSSLSFREGKGSGGKFTFSSGVKNVGIDVRTSGDSSILLVSMSPHGHAPASGEAFLGFSFDALPGFDRGVALWRYKPWNSWTKPVPIMDVAQLADWDVQFFYWRYRDGTYGAAMPLSGKGYRTTLGENAGRLASKSVSLFDGLERDSVPQMAVGFGRDPFALIARLYEEGMSFMGVPGNLRKLKTFPQVFETLGWCTWNSSDNGKNLNENLLLDAARSFRKGAFPIGWFLIDDGWFDHTVSKLNSFEPDKSRFPRGFRPVIDTLKREFHLRDVGVWHAYNGYWQGINPDSPLGEKYRSDLITWKELVRPDADSTTWRTCSFLSPYAPSLGTFFSDFHARIRREGFSFIKVDNQLITERIARGNFPIWDGAERYHAALNASADRTFGNAMINCMDMTSDAYCNFGSTAVARGVEDYFPYEQGETYNLQRGNAAAHVLQAVYNALYFSQMVYSDFDMFQSHNPNAVFHAVARALNNGPVYITDDIGRQNFDVLFPLVFGDGKLIRPDAPLLPAEDCLFQVQDPRPFKAFSTSGGSGLLGIWNCADTDRVEGTFSPSDVHGIKGDRFGVFEHFSRDLRIAGREERLPVSLGRLGCKLYCVIPLQSGNGVVGLVNKYNAPGTVLRSSCTADSVTATVYEGGEFAAVTRRKPVRVTVDGMDVPFTYRDGLVLVRLEAGAGNRTVGIRI